MTEPYRFGLIGHNISYSRSKQIFEAIFKQLGARGSFTLFDIAPDSFTHDVEQLFRDGTQAVSVTIPHKNRIIGLLDDIDPVAKSLDAVNSVCVRGGHRYGFNTDAHGFAEPLLTFKEKLRDAHAVLLGCGGSAKAVLHALYTDFGLRRFSIVTRNPIKLAECKRMISELFPEAAISGYASHADLSTIQTYELLINCTPLGGWNHPVESPLAGIKLLPEAWYYDLNYNDGNIAIKAASDAGMKRIDGSRMLVAQAIRSFYLWTGTNVALTPIYEAVFPEKAGATR